MQKPLKTIAINIGVLLGLLLLTETILRTYRFFQPEEESQGGEMLSDPVLHHVWRPELIRRDSYRDPAYTLEINRFGFVHSGPYVMQKPENTYRIAYLGDSNTQGVVEPDYKLANLVRDALNYESKEKNIKYEVLNTGTSSWSFVQYYLLLKGKLLDFSPDLVILNIDMSDSGNHIEYKKSIIRDAFGDIIACPDRHAMTKNDRNEYVFMGPKGAIRKPRPWLVRISSKYLLLAWFADKAFYNRAYEEAAQSIDSYSDGSWVDHVWSLELEKEVEEALDILRSTIQFAKAHNIKIMVTGVPVYPQYSGRYSTRPHYELAKVALEEGVPYLNSYEALKPQIEGTSVDAFYFKTDPTHFNPAGNVAWSKVQLEFLKDPKNRLLPNGFFTSM